MSERSLVYGLKPVLDLVDRRASEIERIYVALGRHAGLGRLLRQAREAGIPISHLARPALARLAGAGAVHQGVAAAVAPIAYADAEAVCARAAAKEAALLVLADRVVDPRNLGAILRTCAAAGVEGCLLAGEGTVGLTPVVVKASAGAVDRVPVARESHPGKRIVRLRESGFRAFALDPRGPVPWYRADLSGRILLVAGGEERGARPGILRECDERLSIGLAPGVDSLNVAVAVGIVLFEAVRQRGGAPGGARPDA